MEEELLRKVEELARLLMTPQQISVLLGLSGELEAELLNPFSEAGRLYRRVLAEKAKDLHEKTLRLADVGSPSALEDANAFLRAAQIAIE